MPSRNPCRPVPSTAQQNVWRLTPPVNERSFRSEVGISKEDKLMKIYLAGRRIIFHGLSEWFWSWVTKTTKKTCTVFLYVYECKLLKKTLWIETLENMQKVGTRSSYLLKQQGSSQHSPRYRHGSQITKRHPTITDRIKVIQCSCLELSLTISFKLTYTIGPNLELLEITTCNCFWRLSSW